VLLPRVTTRYGRARHIGYDAVMSKHEKNDVVRRMKYRLTEVALASTLTGAAIAFLLHKLLSS